MSVWSTRGEAVAVLGAADDAETGDRDHQDAAAGALLLPVGPDLLGGAPPVVAEAVVAVSAGPPVAELRQPGRHGGPCPCPAGRPQIWLRLPISRIFPPVAGEAAVAAWCDPGRKRQTLCYGGSRAKEGTSTRKRPDQLGAFRPAAYMIGAGLRRACRLSEAGVAVSRSCALTARHLRNGVRVVHPCSGELAGRASNGTRLQLPWRQGPRQL
jgi:hypothetical protein